MKRRIKLHENKPLVLVLLTGALLLGLCQTISAQIIRTNPQVKPTPPQIRPTRQTKKNIPIFKGTGASPTDPETNKFGQEQQIPRTLSFAEKSAALKEVMLAKGVLVKEGENFTVQTYVTLSSQTPFVTEKGNLSYYGEAWVDPLGLLFGEPNSLVIWSGFVRIYVKPDQVGRWYMLDCKVTGWQGKPFHLIGPDGNATEIAFPEDGHLQAFMVSQNTQWQKFTIKRDDAWRLVLCEVSTPSQ